MHRYLIFLPDDRAASRHYGGLLTPQDPRLADFVVRLDHERCVVLSQGRALPVGREGVILGDLFRSGATRPSASLTDHEAAAIRLTRGSALIETYWGPYLAVLLNPRGGVEVVRAPFGDLACYYLACPGGMMLASDVDLLVQFGGYAPTFDWQAIAAHLIAPDLRRARTCLAGVRELAGGQRLSKARDTRIDALWSPWSFVSRDRRCIDRDRAAAKVATAICTAVAARTAGFDSTVLLLSGGLDSSIVAAALATAGRYCTALTMVTQDAAGDERGFARATATHCDIPLVEVVRDVAAVDIACSAAAGLPYPSERSFSQATTASARAVAATTGSGAIVHGGGGDNIFCGVQSAAPVADLLRRGILDRRLWHLTRDIASIAHVSTLAVLRQAITRAWVRPPGYRWQTVPTMLSDNALSGCADAIRHPWLDAPRGALPGSAAHIGFLLAAQSIVQSPATRTDLPAIAVLMAQPVIEACLSVPSWLWFERERNRAIARRGFSTALPESIAWRRSKGAMDSFVIELFEANRSRLRGLLLDGMLAQSGLIDTARLRAVLDDSAPTRGQDYGRVMQFADVEAWLRSWR